jgi:hypothetical protein
MNIKSIFSVKTFLLFSVVCIFYSCGKNSCDTVCDVPYPEIIFTIENNIGQNLASGTNKIYTSDKIKIKYLEGGVLTETEKKYTSNDTGTTSISNSTGILFLPASLSSQYYLYINNVKTDSFQLAYQKFDGKTECCPAYYKSSSLKLNNTPVTVPFKVIK